MSRAPSPLRGPELWDWLRNESLEYRDSFGQYPICKTEAEFVSAVQAFANITMVPGTSRLTFKDGKCDIRGDFIERWSPVGGEGIPDLSVQVTDAPLMGEIHMTSGIPPMMLLYTNVFVTQFTTKWGGYLFGQ